MVEWFKQEPAGMGERIGSFTSGRGRRQRR